MLLLNQPFNSVQGCLFSYLYNPGISCRAIVGPILDEFGALWIIQ